MDGAQALQLGHRPDPTQILPRGHLISSCATATAVADGWPVDQPLLRRKDRRAMAGP